VKSLLDAEFDYKDYDDAAVAHYALDNSGSVSGSGGRGEGRSDGYGGGVGGAGEGGEDSLVLRPLTPPQ